MKTESIKKIFAILLLSFAMVAISSCGYDELPPKTKDASTDYILPHGTIPSSEEQAELKAIREEYSNSTRKTESTGIY